MRAALLGFCLLGWCLGGCAGVHLYNAQRDAFATTAKTDLGKVDFDGFMNTRRANLSALHTRDVALAEASARVTRDQEIMVVLSGEQENWANLDNEMHKVDTSLGADTTTLCSDPSVPPAAPDKLNGDCLLQIENKRGQHQADLNASADGFRLEWRMEPPACDSSANALPDWTSGNPPDAIPARYKTPLKGLDPEFLQTKQLTYSNYLALCRTILADVADETADINPPHADWSTARDSIGDLYNRSAAARNAYNIQVAEVQKDQDALQAAINALTAASQKPPSDSVSTEITKAETEVQTALSALEAAGKGVGLGQSAAAQARLDAINAFLSALTAPSSGTSTSTTVTLTPELATAATVLKGIPALAGSVVTVNNTLHAPHLSALEIEKERQTALVAQATRTASRAQQRVAILQAAFDDRVQELRLLREARTERAKANAASPALRKGPAGGSQMSASEAENTEALDYFQIAVYVGDRATRLERVNELDLDEQASADSAQYAIDTYRAVLTTPINQFVAYEDAGIKPADIAQLLSNIATAVGVNIIAGK